MPLFYLHKIHKDVFLIKGSNQLEVEVVGRSTDLRSTLHMHGLHLRLEPSHGLQGGVVVAQLGAAAHEVLPLEDHHTAALVRL